MGDQIFTDVYGANRTGIRTILVKPIHPKEEIQIVLKRYLEKIVLFFYRRKCQKQQSAAQKREKKQFGLQKTVAACDNEKDGCQNPGWRKK